MPSPGSARAAKAPTPSACDDDNDPDTTAATNHGSAATSAIPTPTAAHSRRDRPDPGAAEHARATVAASIRPVGVIPASAVQNASAQICGHSGVDSEVGSAPRSRSIVVATHGRHP